MDLRKSISTRQGLPLETQAHDGPTKRRRRPTLWDRMLAGEISSTEFAELAGISRRTRNRWRSERLADGTANTKARRRLPA
jgi:hypothetical protein